MKLAATAAIVAALAVLAGCGGSSNSSTTNSSTDAGSTPKAASESLLAGASPEVLLGVNLIADRERQSKLAKIGLEGARNMASKGDQPATIESMMAVSKAHLAKAEADQAQLEKLDPAKHNRAELIYRSEH
jgi:hypothetical protein